MKKFLSAIKGYKTYGGGVLGIIYCVAALTGNPVPGLPEIGHDAAITTIVTSILAMFLRNGIAGKATQ